MYWLGKNQVETAIPLISQQLQSPDKMLQTAAVKSLTKLGTDAAVQVLTQQFITADKETATQISDELLTVDNKNLAGYLASVYPTSTNEGKLAILSLLSSRQLTEQYHWYIVSLHQLTKPSNCKRQNLWQLSFNTR